MRRLLWISLLLCGLGATALVTVAGADDSHEYKIELDNAFGIVPGADVRVAGVNVGSITDLELNDAKRALVSFTTSGPLSQLGVDSTCSTEPQSLIAEYFLDCQSDGEPLPEGGIIPVEQTSQTVQQDLVQNTLRQPFKQRLQLLINEFGTALAGNPENLNSAIRRGAPALRELQDVLSILGDQNRIIRDLNVDSDQIISALAARRDDVVRFVETADATASASAAVRDSLSRDFELLPTFLEELEPTLADLEELALEQTPVLVDLGEAAPELNNLAINLPPFNSATSLSLDALGEAGVVGTRALSEGEGEFRQLAESVRSAPGAAAPLADLLLDIDDPRRATDVDSWAARDTNRRAPTGYTGMESLLNYVYYQAGSLNNFDQVSHLLHFSLYDVFTGPCGMFSTGHDSETGAPGVPAQDGGTTTNFLDAHSCVGWLGANQPGINDDINLPPYDPSVCPHGTTPTAALALCDPAGASSANASGTGDGSSDGNEAGGTDAAPPEEAPPEESGPDEGAEPALPELPETTLPGNPEDLLETLEDLLGISDGSLGGGLGLRGDRGSSSDQQAAQGLLDFLFVD